MRPIRMIGKGIGIIIVVALAAMLFGYFIMSLWNWLIPAIFHGMGVITFWQAVGLLVLTRILFHGFGGGGHRWRHQGGWNHHGHWGYWKQKWESMTPEEREKMKGEWKSGMHSWKQRWHDMGPEEKARMKSQWRNRCGKWGEDLGYMEPNPNASEAKPENPETLKP